jgi:hypothetical protein
MRSKYLPVSVQGKVSFAGLRTHAADRLLSVTTVSNAASSQAVAATPLASTSSQAAN